MYRVKTVQSLEEGGKYEVIVAETEQLDVAKVVADYVLTQIAEANDYRFKSGTPMVYIYDVKETETELDINL